MFSVFENPKGWTFLACIICTHTDPALRYWRGGVYWDFQIHKHECCSPCRIAGLFCTKTWLSLCPQVQNLEGRRTVFTLAWSQRIWMCQSWLKLLQQQAEKLKKIQEYVLITHKILKHLFFSPFILASGHGFVHCESKSCACPQEF